MDIVGVVMLGGASSRMGSDKSELSIEGRTLTQRATDLLYGAGLKEVLLSSGGKSQGIQDLIPEKGPLSGMHAVVSQGSGTQIVGFVFLPVDMPRVTTSLVKALLEAGCANTTACHFKDWPMPCYLPNTARVKETLDQALVRNELAVKYLLKTLNAVELPWQEFNQDVFTNINTPLQWSKYQTSISGKPARGQ